MISRWLFFSSFLALLWLVLARGDTSSLIIGLPAIAFALTAFNLLNKGAAPAIQILKLPRFILWFAWLSLRGGFDVAWRTLQPKMPLKPGFVWYELSLPDMGPRVFLVNALSLLPGTLSVDIKGDKLLIHALDTDADILDETWDAEQQVAILYGLSLGERHD